MTITKIEKQKNDEKRYSIYIDNNFSFGLDEQDLIYFKLKELNEISQERYNYIMEYVVYSKAKDKAFRFLGYKARTEKELKDKLNNEGYPEEIIIKIIELFKYYGYINDEIYAKGHINNRLKFKPMGKKLLKYELLKKGVDNDIIENTINNLEIDELDIVTKLIEKKTKNKSEFTQKDKEKLYNYLLRKGFNYDIINKAIKTINFSD